MKGLKTFWLNIGALDKDLDLTGRQQILKALSSEGVEVRSTFNYLEKHDALLGGIDKVFLFKIGGMFSSLMLIIKQQLLLMRNLDVDFIILREWKVHETLPLFFWLRFVLKKKKPYFILDLRTVPVDLKGTLRHRINVLRFKSSIRMALGFLDGLTVISEKLKQDIVRDYNCSKDQVSVWTTGVDPSHFDPATVGDMRKTLGIEDRFVVMYHGIFSPFRGLQQVIRAISLLKDNYPDLLFILLGKGEAKGELESLVVELGLHDHVLIHPPVKFKEVPKFINSADCGILPFPDREWWNTSGPLKLNEYLAIGKPVVLTEIAAHKAVFDNEPFGFYSKNEDPVNLAGAIEAVRNVEDRETLNKKAREFALKRLTWEKQAQNITSFFSSFL